MGEFTIGSELKESLDSIFKVYWKLISQKFNQSGKWGEWKESIGWMENVLINRDQTITLKVDDLAEELGFAALRIRNQKDLKFVLDRLNELTHERTRNKNNPSKGH